MHYTYVLLSESAGRFYTGYSADLRKRLVEHQRGRVHWTAARLAVRLIYYEACLSQDDALRRERFFKSGKGKRYLRNRLATHLRTLSRNRLERH
ncbi:MAG: GIY-YIG nuclease family protein [Candidatus Acidiferrales bacterium]